MHTLQLPFKMLTLTGVWMPKEWTLTYQKLLWSLFATICIALMIVECSTQIIFTITAKTWEEFHERLFFIPTTLSCLQKVFMVIFHRKQLIQLANMLLTYYCVPRNAQETMIQAKYDQLIRILTIASTVLANIPIINMIIVPLVTGLSNHTLPIPVWLPYEINSDFSYWWSYITQSLGISLVGTSIVGSTLMINGFMYQVCAQFEILSYRFDMLPKIIKNFQLHKKPYQFIYEYEKKAMKRNICHHLYIFRFANTVNDIFKPIIGQQFCLSSILISMSILQLSTRSEKDSKFIMVLSYLVVVLIEFFVYSWFGNEVTYESLNFQHKVYAIDWTSLSTNTGKDMAFVMLRTSKPIVIDCGYFVVLSLDSYIHILKLSYSVFNILIKTY